MAIGIALTGFLLLDVSLNPIAFNSEAVRILAYPVKPERVKRPATFLADKVRSELVSHGTSADLAFAKVYKSGNRRYTCRSFRLDCNDQGKSRLWIALLLERYSAGTLAVTELGKQFDLTAREQETVEFLLQGLTSKEIAIRMHISPNTVKAFLRLVMLKMDVSTRSGIVGKMVAASE
jgi:DNA-binding CsgD family transcriptional regulator